MIFKRIGTKIVLGILLVHTPILYTGSSSIPQEPSSTFTLITVDKDMKEFIIKAVHYFLDNHHSCSDALIRCYISLQNDANHVDSTDLYEAVPDLLRFMLILKSIHQEGMS